MKIHVKSKHVETAKPGQLLESTIKYGAGDSASVTHRHAPTPREKGAPWMGMDEQPLQHNFGTRAEALHHVAQYAGVASTLDDAEDQAEMSHGKKPTKREEMAEAS
jgi:hypothetical protein